MTQQLDDGRLNPSKTPCFWREIVAAANSEDLKKTKAAFTSIQMSVPEFDGHITEAST